MASLSAEMDGYDDTSEPVLPSPVGRKRSLNKQMHKKVISKRIRHSGGGEIPSIACQHRTADHAGLCHAGLCHAGLCHAGLCHAGLCHAGLCHAGLCHAGLCHAGLCHAGLCHTGMCHAGLCHTGLCHAGLCHAGLCHAGLCHAGLCHAGLCHTGLCHAGLCHAGLCHAGLCHAGLGHADQLNGDDLGLNHAEFYPTSNKVKQEDALLKLMTISSSKRQRVSEGDRQKPRNVIVKYSLFTNNRDQPQMTVPVCKATFTKVLGVYNRFSLRNY